MKTITLVLITFSLGAPVYANGGPYATGIGTKAEGSPILQEEVESNNNIRKKAAGNLRNQTFPESFEGVQDEHQKEEDRGVKKMKERWEGDPFIGLP